MNTIDKNSIQFDYFSNNYKQFEDDFYTFSDINIPLTFLTDDILKMMTRTKKSYFRLNSLNSKDKKDHYFIFKLHTQADNKQVLRYEYVGHKYPQ